MNYLRRSDFVLINRMTVERHGGNYVPPENLLHGENLDYIVETVAASMFGEELYPSLSDKAAFYAFSIIANHVFSDGNKRTGLEAAQIMLRMNGHRISHVLRQLDVEGTLVPATGGSEREQLTAFILEVASGKHSLDVVRRWFAHNTERDS